jgi:hypothetical protein
MIFKKEDGEKSDDNDIEPNNWVGEGGWDGPQGLNVGYGAEQKGTAVQERNENQVATIRHRDLETDNRAAAQDRYRGHERERRQEGTTAPLSRNLVEESLGAHQD